MNKDLLFARKEEAYQRQFLIEVLRRIKEFPYYLHLLDYVHGSYPYKHQDELFHILGIPSEIPNNPKIKGRVELKDYIIEMDEEKHRRLIEFFKKPRFLFSNVTVIQIKDKKGNSILEAYDHFTAVGTAFDDLEYNPPRWEDFK